MPPNLLEPPRRVLPPVPRSRYRLWNWRRQVVMGGLRLCALALLILLGWGAWYLANKGFSREWRTTVADELRKRGVEASVRRLTLDPFRGLVAQDLRIYDFKNRDQPLAVISEVSLDINYAALLHRQPFLNSIDVRDANVTFPNPGGDPNAPRAQLQNFRAHVYFPPEQIVISQAEGIFNGVRISATGQLIKRNDYKPTREVTPEEWKQRMQWLQRVAAQLQAFNFAGGPPNVQVNFAGDLAHMEEARIEATLRGERMQRGAYEIKTFTAAAEWAAQKLNLRQLEWNDPAGNFVGQASWSAATRAATFEAQSTLDVKALLEAFGYGKLLADATFAGPPTVELSGSLNFTEAAPRLQAVGRVGLANFSYKTVPFLGLAADYSWDGTRTMLRDVRLRHGSGELHGDLLDAPGDFRLNLESSLNPGTLRGLAPSGIAKFLGEWEWPRSPSVRMAIRGPSRDGNTWKGEGAIKQARTRFRGIWMNSLSADVRLAPGAITFEDLRVVRDEGIGTGAFTYDFAHREVRVDQVKTSLHPTDAIYWIVPKLHKVVAPYNFRSAPTLTANGVVTLKGRDETRLEIGVQARDGMDYVFLGKNLPFDRVQGDIFITDDNVKLSKMEGGLFGGVVRGEADISTVKGDERHRASVAVEGIDFPTLTKLYFDFETARGDLTGNYDFTGVADNARAMRGTGKIKVSNGDVFAIPVFGPLSGLISAIIPGAGYSVAKEATASFTIREGVIKTDDFKVSGKLFGMVGKGEIFFLDDKLDFDVRMNAKGPGVLLTPVYELFEYKGEGSLAKPNWHPKRF